MTTQTVFDQALEALAILRVNRTVQLSHSAESKVAGAVSALLAAKQASGTSQEALRQAKEALIKGYKDGIYTLKQFAEALDALAALATVSDASPSPVSVQPISEQAARFAIDGAIGFGRMGVNKPPSDDHWLMPFWLIGGECAKAAQPAQPASSDVQPVAPIRLLRTNAEYKTMLEYTNHIADLIDGNEGHELWPIFQINQDIIIQWEQRPDFKEPVNTVASLEAASGSMTDFAEAADLVDKITAARTNGDALGIILGYRQKVRMEALSTQPAAPVQESVVLHGHDLLRDQLPAMVEQFWLTYNEVSQWRAMPDATGAALQAAMKRAATPIGHLVDEEYAKGARRFVWGECHGGIPVWAAPAVQAAPSDQPELDCIEYDPAGKLVSADVIVGGERVKMTRQAAPSVPDGCAVVPKEPTPEMIEAAQAEDTEGEDDPLAAWRSVYLAMIAAAPSAPSVSADKPDAGNVCGQSKETDLSKRLREIVADKGADALSFLRHQMLLAADEIERYYGGMLAWKATAEAKDRATTTSASVSADAKLLDWLQEQVVDVIYLDDGRFIDVKGNSVREAIRAAIATQSKEPKGASDE